MMTRILFDKSTKTSTNAYANMIGHPLTIIAFAKLTITIRETGATNGITWSIDVSMDNSNWHNLITNQALAAGAKTYQTLTDLWNYLRVQIKSTVADSHGAGEVYVLARDEGES